MTNFVPKTNKTGGLGTSSKMWKEVNHVTASFDTTSLVDEGSVLTVKDGSFAAGTVDASGHNGSNAGLKLGGTLVTATASQINVLGSASSDGEFLVATGAGALAYESGATVRTSLGLGTGDSPTFTSLTLSAQAGALAMNSQKITGLATPTASGDAATKGYVDGVAQGLDVKDSVHVATTAAITLASALENGDTIDGVTLATGDRVLVKDQSTASENGIYVVAASGAPARAADMAASSQAAGVFVFVEEGTVNADVGFVCTTNNSADTVGTNNLTFSQFSGAGTITAGDGLAKNGSTLSVNVDDSSLEINSDTLRVKAAGITNASLNASVITGQTAMTGDVVDTDELLISDAGTLKKVDFSVVRDAVFNDISGDATVAAGGALTIGSATIETAMVNANVITGQTAETSIADGDLVLIYDTSASALRKMTKANFVSGLGGGGLSNVVEDTTPQLGGSLDVNGQDIVTVSNGNITLTPNGSGVVRIDGTTGIDLQSGEIAVKNSGSVSNIKLYCETGNAHYTQIQSAAHASYSGNVTLTLPTSTGTLVGSGDTGTVTNTMLAGAIANGKLANSAVTVTAGNGLSGGGSVALGATTSLALDLNELTAAVVDVANDSIVIVDANDSNASKKESVADLVAGIAGTGLSASSGQLSIDGTVTTLAGSQTLTNKTLTSAVLNTGVSGTAILDEDDLNSNSATKLATQQSIKAYVDAQVAGGGLNIDGYNALGGTGLHQTQDHFVFSDNGTEKKITFSNLEDAIFANISGDATIAAGGALTIGANAVEGSMLNNNTISGQTEMTGDVADADELLISDAGTLKRADFSVVRDAVFNDVSGDATIAAGGALTIAATSVENSMLAGSITANKMNNAIFADLETLGAPASDGQFIVATGSGAFAYESANTARTSLGLGTGDSPTFTSLTLSGQAAALAMNSQKITGLATPTADGDAATKSYVDGVAQGLSAKDSVRATTTANGTLASAFANGQAIDGVTIATGDRILIKNQTSGAENGIYTVNASGAPTRAVDFDANAEVAKGAFIFVEEGTVNADAGFVLTTDGAITLGTTALAFTQFSGAGDITAGSALTKSGNTLNVAVDDSSIEVSSDALRVKASGITSAMLAGSIANSKLNTISTANKVALSSLDLDGGTDIGADLVDADLVIVDDGAGGTNRKSALSRMKKYIFSAVSGDATASDAGALSLASTSITGQTAETSIADDDLILISDTSASGALRKMTKANFVSGLSGATAADDISVGDAAVTIATSAGNITLDAQGDNRDIIFKGTDGGSDTTFLTLDGSDAGTAIFNHDIKLLNDNAKLSFGTNSEVYFQHAHDTGLNLHLNGPDSDEPKLSLKNTSDTARGPQLEFYHSRTNYANGDVIGSLNFQAKSSNSQLYNYCDIRSIVNNVASNDWRGQLDFRVIRGANNSIGTALSIIGNNAGGSTVDISDHDGSAEGLKLGGTLVTSTAAELNLLDGVTATTAEINLLDGGTSATSTTLVDADRVIVNDAGTMKQVALSDVKTYIGAGAADDITTGDAAVTIATSAGNITLDAQGSDTDIIFKGTDGSADTTFLTLDGSAAGAATFNSSVTSGGALLPSAANTHALGSASAEWADLYLGDSSYIYFGSDQDVVLQHQADTGLTLDMSVTESNFEPVFKIKSSGSSASYGPTLDLFYDKTAPTTTQRLGQIRFSGRDDAGNTQYYGYVGCKASDDANGSEVGKIFLSPAPAATTGNVKGLTIEGVAGDSNKILVDVESHNGTDAGLKLGSTLVTATAAELNKLDGATITTTELNLLDGGTSATSTTLVDADRVIVNDAGTMKQVALSDVKTYIGAGAADDLTTGDAAVTIATSAGNITIDAQGNDTDIIFKGTDNSSDITMLTLDGSEAGDATFNRNVTVTGDIILDDGGSIKEAGGTAAITIDASGEVTKIGQDSPSDGQVLTWDNSNSKVVWAAASGGGGSQLPPEVKTVSSAATLSLTPSNASTYNSIEVIYTATGSSAYTVTLPTAASIEGKKIHVKRLATANITVDGDGSETIDGSATFVLTSQYSSVTLISDGTNWIII